MYTRTTREPTEAEAHGLRRRLAVQARHGPTARRMALVSLGLCGLLWGLTVAAAKAVLWPTVAWGALALTLTAWSWLEARLRRSSERRRLEGAIACGRVDEVGVTASEMVRLEEVKDLGPTWAFQVGPEEILFLADRQDLPRGFPTGDFSLATYLDADGGAIDVTWSLRGERLQPVRTITVEAQRATRRPNDLERLAGRLDELERLLRGTG